MSAPAAPIRLTSVARQSGIRFRLGNSGKSPLTIAQTAGGGCAFLDYDGDGWPDILLVGPYNVGLYHNLRDGRFEDVTTGSGLDPHRYWMGCAVGDYDGDGRPDIFLTGYHCFALYHNEGHARFRNVTAAAGISGLDWSISGVFADLRGTGRLDLYVSQYVRFDSSTRQLCRVGPALSACGPEVYDALSGRLFANDGNGRFHSVPWRDTGKSWGALATDLLDKGRPLLYVADDQMPADLWERQASGWKNIAAVAGTAYDGQGRVAAWMGVDSGDYDNDGRLDLISTTYFGQQAGLFHNDGGGLFSYTSGLTGLGPPTMPYVKFGTAFADLDNDGWLDVVMTCGHVRDNIHDIDAAQSYAQPILLFHNERGKFVDCSDSSGDAAHDRLVGRGLSVADFDRDGRQDILICNLEGSAELLRNESPRHHWLDVQLQQSGANRFGIGSRLTLEAAGATQVREVRTCGSVMSAFSPVAHFGLMSAASPAKLTVRWPDGESQVTDVTTLDRTLVLRRVGQQRH